MPITTDFELRKLSQDEFGRIAYEVMRHAFDIHRELGRFFDEGIYQAELAHRCSGARIEVPLEVSFRDFKKVYLVDIVIGNGAIFEVKTTEAIHDRHRAQLLNYLLLTGLTHGKLINFRPEVVEHEFLNTTITKADRTTFEIDDRGWQPTGTASAAIKPYLTDMLRDLGAGLDLHLYEEAIIHIMGGRDSVIRAIDVTIDGRLIGKQELACSPDGAGMKFTALKPKALDVVEVHYRRLLRHTGFRYTGSISIARP